MCSWMKQSRQENLIYLIVWSLLFAAPVLSLYVWKVHDANLPFDWAEVFFVWRRYAVYLLLFLVHNLFLAPLLMHRHKRVAYFSVVAVIIALFTLYQCSHRPDMKKPIGHRPPPDVEMTYNRHPSFGKPRHQMRPHKEPHPFIGEHDIMAVVLLILMFGANVGIKGYFRGREDRRRLAELEHENLEQQLEYLRYQINPHFFMNTLNNIHALVDIDPEKAKDTIVELSKMMRYVLYEGDKQYVPLSNEFEFIRHYVTLMQLRYTDKVRITLELPGEVSNRKIPPLILITFIENAFKHGVSYQHESFVEVKVTVEGNKLCFCCRNSKAPTARASAAGGQQGGVGLANVRKRLNLLYDHDYSLRIDDAPDVYGVDLVISLNS